MFAGEIKLEERNLFWKHYGNDTIPLKYNGSTIVYTALTMQADHLETGEILSF